MRDTHIGEVYGRLTITKKLERGWLVTCSCGEQRVQRSIAPLLHGRTKSCGCLNIEMIVKRNRGRTGIPKTHGASNENWYSNWRSMTNRLRSKGADRYTDGHIIGPFIEDAWLKDPWAFFAEIGEKPGPEYSIDRIDNNKGYVIGNVRWATSKQQANNRRITRSLPNSGERNILITKSGTYKVKTQGTYLGTFKTLEEAVAARDEFKRREAV